MALTGKISRAGTLKYTPSGVPVYDFTVAVAQRQFDRESIGYFEAMIFGSDAEEASSQIRVGKKLQLKGSLWSRAFKNRQGIKINETKIIVHSIGGTGEKE